MTLYNLGYSKELETYVQENELSQFIIGRVIREHRERYAVSDGENEYDAEITGNLRFTATSRSDFPAVGDWIAMTVFDASQAFIHSVLPRKSVLERQAIGKHGEKQVIGANIDYALIVQSIDSNFNINRLERYLTICYSAVIEPLLVISKVDLAGTDEINNVTGSLAKRDKKVATIFISNQTKDGLTELENILEKGKSYCLVGSSGVGKSSLVNNLQDRVRLKTGEISSSTNKGRHITSHRELFILDNGAIIIDTPGMRELGITEDEDGLKGSFEEIITLGQSCRFNNCTHTDEAGCAILEAIDNGDIDPATFENYRKIEREQQRFTSTIAEKRKKDRDRGKLIKSILKRKKDSQ